VYVNEVLRGCKSYECEMVAVEDDIDVRVSGAGDRALRRARGQRFAHGQGDGDSSVRAQVRIAVFGLSYRVAGAK
jgi:hypothetical protein